MKNIYLYGASKKAIDNLLPISLYYNIKGFIDGDIEKVGRPILGLPVYHSDEIHGLKFDQIIITTSFHKEVIATLEKQGVENYCSVDDIDTVVKLREEYKGIQRLTKLRQLEKIPLTPLSSELIRHVQLIGNRTDLLTYLPRNAVVAELGVAAGDFSKQIIQVANPLKLFLIDPWDSHRYGEKLFSGVLKRFNQSIKEGKVQVIRDYSTCAVSGFQDDFFDWIYIDTDHSYETTKQELELYASKVKSNGIIAGHDYSMGNWADEFKYGVIEAVHEFCEQNRYEILYITMNMKENQSFAIRKVST